MSPINNTGRHARATTLQCAYSFSTRVADRTRAFCVEVEKCSKRSGIFRQSMFLQAKKVALNMQTARFVVKQIFTPNRGSNPIMRSFCKLGSSIVRKWCNWIPIQKSNEAQTNWHLQNCTLRQNTWNYKPGVQPVINGQACKYMKTLVKNTC
jgi:hypothetical protein